VITEVLLNLVFGIINGIIGTLSMNFTLPNYVSQTIHLLSIAFSIFPADLFFALLANFLAWQSIHFGWAMFEWIYKKIPGVD